MKTKGDPMTFAEAFTDFVSGPGNKERVYKCGEEIGIRYDTYRKWVMSNRPGPPKGENRIKVSLYLINIGYVISDFTKDPELIKACSLVVQKRTTFNEILEFMESSSLNHLYKVIFGENKLMESKILKLREFLKRFSDQDDTPKTDFDSERPCEVERREDDYATPDSLIGKGEVVEIAAAQIIALSGQVDAVKKLTELIESDSFTDKDRALLRARVGQKAFFELTNEMFSLQRRLSSLSSRLQRESNLKGK